MVCVWFSVVLSVSVVFDGVHVNQGVFNEFLCF